MGKPPGSYKIQRPQEDAMVRTVVAMGFSVPIMAAAAGVAYETVKQHLVRRPGFAARVERANGEHFSKLVTEAIRRGVEGTDSKILWGPDGKEHRFKSYSDALLQKLLKRADPDGFSDRVQVDAKVAHSGSLGVDLSKLSPEQLALIDQVVQIEAQKAAIAPAIDDHALAQGSGGLLDPGLPTASEASEDDGDEPDADDPDEA